VITRILHFSDLHFGARGDVVLEDAMPDLLARVNPDLVVATGDLTHRGRRDQHDRAAAFLRGLGPPVVAIPGNHDIPYTFPARFTRPWAEFERLSSGSTRSVHGATSREASATRSSRASSSGSRRGRTARFGSWRSTIR
jgi:3',5'-cyclic AMP phosphodiesterase CpdA